MAVADTGIALCLPLEFDFHQMRADHQQLPVLPLRLRHAWRAGPRRMTGPPSLTRWRRCEIGQSVIHLSRLANRRSPRILEFTKWLRVHTYLHDLLSEENS